MESPTAIDKGHGRIESREYKLFTDISWLEQRKEWKNLMSAGAVKSIVYEKEEER